MWDECSYTVFVLNCMKIAQSVSVILKFSAENRVWTDIQSDKRVQKTNSYSSPSIKLECCKMCSFALNLTRLILHCFLHVQSLQLMRYNRRLILTKSAFCKVIRLRINICRHTCHIYTICNLQIVALLFIHVQYVYRKEHAQVILNVHVFIDISNNILK
jgi:hypothetical protein